MLFGIFGVLSALKLPHRARYILAHACVVLVGFGSFVFHTTLKWHAQVLLDELPMLWSVSVALYTTSVGARDKGSLALKLLIAAVPISVSALYLRYPNPILHQVAFAGIIFVSAFQWIQLFQSLPSVTASQVQNRVDCKRQFITGAVSFASGFVIWNIDNIFCNQLTAFRGRHGDIVGALSQGHAWWHILTGLGVSRLFCAMTYLTLAVRQPDEFELAYFLGLPYVQPKKEAERLRLKGAKSS